MNTQCLIDQANIVALINRFYLAIDERDYQTMRTCLTNDVKFDYSAWFRTIMPSTADESVEEVSRNHRGFRSTQHITANHLVSIEGDMAT
jgi:hypothetical protein